jgi:hypothetical protein
MQSFIANSRMKGLNSLTFILIIHYIGKNTMSAQHYHLQQEMTSNNGKLITDSMLSIVHTQKRKYRSIYSV